MYRTLATSSRPARWSGAGAQRHTCKTARSSTDTELLNPSDFEKQIDFARALRGRAVEHPNFTTCDTRVAKRADAT